MVGHRATAATARRTRRPAYAALLAAAGAMDAILGAVLLDALHHPGWAAWCLYAGVCGAVFTACWYWAGRR
jgi:hypothetical protein